MRRANRRPAAETPGWCWKIVQRRKKDPVRGILHFFLNEIRATLL